MNTYTFEKNRGTAKLIALLVTAALAASVFVINLGVSFASATDINVTLECESGITAANHIEVGATKTRTAYYMSEARSMDTAIAVVNYTPGSGLDNIRTTGVRAGVVGVAYGTKEGIIGIVRYQITDSNNVSAYNIKDGGEVYFTGPGASKVSPVEVTAGAFNRIAWKSMNDGVATVDSNGRVTAKGIGATIIIGSFTDKWGVPRDLHLLVGVGVKLSDSDLADLIDLIKEGEKILTENPGQWTTDSLHDLEDAVNNGKDVINSTNPDDQTIKDAIKEIEDAINGMDKRPQRPDEVVGPDKDGNYYRPIGDPENVYEVVDENGHSKQPPEFVYNPDGDPVAKPDKNRPAYPDGGSYYVEDPEGSNIYKPVNGGGVIKDKPAVWGGPDGMFGGGDDECVNKFGDDYWKHLGQNIWQKVDKNNPTQLVPTLIGGGPDNDPATDPVTPIYKHDDKYYVGPLPPGAVNGYYYGDKMSGGDGKVNSTTDMMHPTDDKYYLVDGKMVPESELTGIPGIAGTNIGDPIVIDGLEWTKVRVDDSGKYALLILNDKIGPSPYDEDQGFNREYIAAGIRIIVESWYGGLNAPTLKKFANQAMIGTDDYMTWPYTAGGSGTGIYAFIPKRSDIQTLPASKRNLGFDYWTATKTKSGDFVGYQIGVNSDGDWVTKSVVNLQTYARPAIWVKMQ